MSDINSASAESSSSGSGVFNLGSAGALGVGALGLGALLAKGEGSLPEQYTQLEGQVLGLQNEASVLEGQGGSLVNQGTQALSMAQQGQLTPEQQAQLKVYSTGLENRSRQQFASMGRNPDQDTAFINQTANNDTMVNAMAQQQIQSTITLGLGQISSGGSLIGQGLGFENAANSALIAAGEAQVKLDASYSDGLTKAFTAIGQMVGVGVKAAAA